MLRSLDQNDSLFEYINCPLCGSNNYEEAYVRNHYFDHDIGYAKIANVICQQCGFMYMNPRFRVKALQAHYRDNSSGDVYHSSDPEFRHGKLIYERKAFIESYLVTGAGGNFLDIGCGQAELLRALELDAWQKYGVEPSGAPLRAENENHIFRVTIQNFTSEIVFGAISCISALEHFVDPVSCLKKINRLLKDKGYLFVEVPDSTNPEAQIAEFFSFEHLSHFTKRTLEKILTMCGFCVVDYDSNVSVNNIRCVAQKSVATFGMRHNHVQNGSIWMGHKNELAPVISKYKRDRQLILTRIGNNISNMLNQLRHQSEKIAIYGAGMHTRFLLHTFDLSDVVECLIDSDSKKAFTRFQEWLVYPPDYIPKLHVGAILISSHDFEKEIFQNIKKYNKNNIKVFKCYEI